MELGCGIRVKTVKRRQYLYVWHYESVDGRRRQAYEYIGPAASAESRRKAINDLEGYARRAIEDARRRLQARKAIATAPGTRDVALE